MKIQTALSLPGLRSRSLNLNRWTFIKTALIILSLTSYSVAASFLNLNTLKSLLGYETCSPPSVRDGKTAVALLEKNIMGKELNGQHLAQKTILTAVKMHLEDPLPSKALVLSFHGSTGSGIISFSTELIIKALYEKGKDSLFVKYFSPSHPFPDAEKVIEYKTTLKDEVIKTMNLCERSLFIFDKVDKLPAGLLDVLGPLIKPVGRLEDGLNVKKSIFMFHSNSGATKINEILAKAKRAGKPRESLNLKDFEEIILTEAFENNGGWYKSDLIDKILVDWFIPFFPVEREPMRLQTCLRRDRLYNTVYY